MHRVYSHIEDDQLLALLRNNDDQAFTEIYNRYWDRMLYVAGVKSRNLDLAEEIVQDVFLDIWNRRNTLDITGTLEAYLAVSVKYKVINAQARQKHFTRYQQQEFQTRPGTDNSTEEWLTYQELKQRLSALVAGLPEKCRITYQLSREFGLSHKEIAEKMQVTEKAVEANLARAVQSLRKAIAGFLSSFFI